MWIIPIPQATYCANPDLVDICVKICPAADITSIGVRLGTYLQCISYFVLVLVAPDEGGAEALWLSMSVSYAFMFACFVQLFLGAMSLHHTITIATLSSLPYVATLAGMNSLTSYRGLGTTGMRVLQISLLLKAFLTAFLWWCCLYAWFHGPLPSWTSLEFRQPHCFKDTAIVSFFVPLRSTDDEYGRSKGILLVYTAFWAIILLAGSYWTFKAPIVLRRRGGFLNPHPKKNKIDLKFLMSTEEYSRHRKEREAKREKRDPADYTPESSDEDMLLISTMRSLPKGKNRSDNLEEGGEQHGNERGIHTTSLLSAEPLIAPTHLKSAQQSAQAWSAREREIRHHFIIWPAVAILLVFCILTIELQIAMNDIFPGEMHWDFPGTLTFVLALPTVWSVIKACMRIREGRRPIPTQRKDETFFEMSHRDSRASRGRRRSTRGSSRRQRKMSFLSAAESSDEVEGSVARSNSRARHNP